MEFRIQGLDCAEEVAILKRQLGPLVSDPESLRFDVLNGKLIVSDEEGLSADQIIRTVNATGMRAELWDQQQSESQSGFWESYGRLMLTIASGSFALAGFLNHVIQAGAFSRALGSEGMAITLGVPVLSVVLYLIGSIAGIWFVAPKAWRAARTFRPDMNLLMVIAVIGAAAIGEWFEAATVAFLFALSLLLESWSVGRARRAIAALMNLTPPVTRIRTEAGELAEVASGTVPLGSVFIVRPSEKIPLDGRVISGESDVNQAPITGNYHRRDLVCGAQGVAGRADLSP